MYAVYISCYFLFVFFGFGALFPMLGLHFEAVGLSGGQIGMLMSVAPVVAILVQPLWGMICDRTQKPKEVLTLATLLTGVVVLLFLFTEWYLMLIVIVALLSFFQSAIVPVSDSLAMNYVKQHGGEYGSLRLWGAVGFAVSVWVSGVMIELTSTRIIFYIFAGVLVVAAWFATRMPEEGQSLQVDIRSGLAKLVKLPAYVAFLVCTFLIFGTMNANNFYFSLYYLSIGGTVAGAGLVFLLAAGSEAPFMKIAGKMMRRYGVMSLLIVAAVLSGARWLMFYFEPSTWVVLAVSILQGISIGFFIPCAVHLVRELAPDDVKVTAMSIYASMGNGLGTMFCTFVGGWIYEYFSIAHTYLFFAAATLVGVGLLILIRVKWFDEQSGIS
ncbi:MFS transporter [Caldalkalibacillus thermarum TA2.A1]|nr:MFS transporter [Caldalkalibacillus thermarum]QZT32527.1 MFS transporter [Caldalkalibacillus thermarum TA2.A1]